MTVSILSSALFAAGVGSAVIVCPEQENIQSPEAACQYFGSDGLRQAVQNAEDDSVIILRSGTYFPKASDDTSHGEIDVRAFLTVREAQNLTLRGEGTVTIDGAGSSPMSFMVVERGRVALENLHISNFGYAMAEDDIYDGHGIYAINSDVTLSQITLNGIEKMAISAHGTGHTIATDVKVLDSHIGLWLEDKARMTVDRSIFANGDTAGMAAYGTSKATITRSMFSGYSDDGLYAAGDAHIYGKHLLITGNAPFGARAAGRAKIRLENSILSANAQAVGTEGAGTVQTD